MDEITLNGKTYRAVETQGKRAVVERADEQAARIRALEKMIAAHEWCSSKDGYPACPECGESPYAVDTGTGEPIPGTHNPGCAWGEAARRGRAQMPGGEG